jgi:membrane-bound ClpP family serine protease
MENDKSTKKPMQEFAFGRENYIMLIIAICIIVLGFILMSGGGSQDPEVFSEDIFSFRRITLAPIVVLFGYFFVMYAIMKKPKNKKGEESEQQA